MDNGKQLTNMADSNGPFRLRTSHCYQSSICKFTQKRIVFLLNGDCYVYIGAVCSFPSANSIATNLRSCNKIPLIRSRFYVFSLEPNNRKKEEGKKLMCIMSRIKATQGLQAPLLVP